MTEKSSIDSKDIMKKNPIVEEVDISEGWDTQSEREIIFDKIHSLPTHSPSDLYRGVDGSKLNVILAQGRENIETDEFFAMTEADSNEVLQRDMLDPYGYALNYDAPGIAIYDSAYLTPTYDFYRYELREGFKYRDALKGVLLIKHKEVK